MIKNIQEINLSHVTEDVIGYKKKSKKDITFFHIKENH